MQQTNNTYPFYGPEDIKRYLSGGMNAQEMHDMEKAALSDPLLADAIDGFRGFRGFRNANAAIVDKHLNDIRVAILGTQEKENLVVPIAKNNNNWWRWAAAACSLGLVAGSIWWFTQRNENGINRSPVAVIEKPTAEQQKDVPFLQKSDSVESALTDIKKSGKIPAPSVAEQPAADLSEEKPKISAFSKSKITSVPVEAAPEIVADAPLIASKNVLQPAQNQEVNKNKMLLNRKAQGYGLAKEDFKAAVLAKPPNMIYGKVTDKRGVPVPSATIVFSPNKGTVTNSDGSFVLPAGDSSVKATISMVSYQQTVATLTPGQTNNIILSKMDQNMDETVVVGYGKQQRKKGEIGDFQKFKTKTETAQNELIYPEEGWTDFYQELGSNLGVDKSKATKTLQIKFTVDENGDPVDFTIVQSPDEILTKKAIEFIKKSKWKNFKLDKNALVKIEVN